MNALAKNIEYFYPLSPMQQGMFFHSLYAPESGVYIEQTSCTLRGKLDIRAFERAWQQVLARHPILRTAFIGEKLAEPVQVVHRQVDLPLQQQNWQGLSSAEQQQQLDDLLLADRRRGFEMSRPPLMRLVLIQMEMDLYRLVWTHHHILLDGWSTPILFQEVFALYDAFCRKEQLPLPLPRPYRDYIVWLKRQDMGQAEAFWRQTLKGFTTPTSFGVGRSLESVADQPEQYADLALNLSAAKTSALQLLARRQHLTQSTLIQGVWALLLSRYNAQDDIVFGVTVSGRPTDLPGSESMIGLFINTLPVRVRVSPQAPLLPWLQELQAQNALLRQYEYSPLVQVQGWSEAPRGQPLFSSILVFENYPIDTSRLAQGQDAGLSLEQIQSFEQTNYPLTVVAGAGEELQIRIVYDCRLFDAGTIQRMLGHMQTLLDDILKETYIPDSIGPRLASLSLLTLAERDQLVDEWNRIETPLPQDPYVHRLIEQRAAEQPDAVALVFQDTVLTYGELDRRANQVAHFLRRQGVGPEVLVGLCIERSLEMIVGLLGILKAGGAYLPLDPEHPRERLDFILSDTRAYIVLTQQKLTARLPTQGISHVCLDTEWPHISREPVTSPENLLVPQNMAYAIYTSGSTGRPKGVLLHHLGLCNVVTAYTYHLQGHSTCHVSQFFSLNFDASIVDIFPTLVSGAVLSIVTRESSASVTELWHLMQEHEITHLGTTPALLALLPTHDLPALQQIICGGEVCSRSLSERWIPGVQCFVNAYGPTETSVAAAWYPVKHVPDEAMTIPIGRPIANARLYVLDPAARLLPAGVPGELYVGGMGVGRGYLNRPGLTAERFLPDPFALRPGARVYRTGDLVRYLSDANIEFLGRIDNQVKVRGFRIELGEIENLLAEHPHVLQSAVAVWNGKSLADAASSSEGDRRLVAYIVPRDGSAFDTAQLRAYLQEKLPAYMIPSDWVMLSELPRSISGKVDRRALPVPGKNRPSSKDTYVGPRDELELRLVQVWEEILGVQSIGVQDNFFELGGHSLLAVRVVAQVQQRLGKDLSLITLFQQPTIEQVAGVLRQEGGFEASALVPLQLKGSRPPLFFVHPSGGSVHWYADLARHLDAEQPFYGLQAQGLDGSRPLHTRIEDMAAHYVRAIRTVQPSGPYYIGSWSMGVIIVFEMAQQLDALGEKVALLAMLDQGPAMPTREPQDQAEYLVEVFGKHVPLSLPDLQQLEPDAQVAHVWEEARRIKWIYPDITLAQFQHFCQIMQTHTQAWRRYEARLYPGQITLFRARKQSPGGPEDRDMGWARLANSGVQIYDVPGDHLSMMHRPQVRTLARQLQTCLNEIQKTFESVQR